MCKCAYFTWLCAVLHCRCPLSLAALSPPALTAALRPRVPELSPTPQSLLHSMCPNRSQTPLLLSITVTGRLWSLMGPSHCQLNILASARPLHPGWPALSLGLDTPGTLHYLGHTAFLEPPVCIPWTPSAVVLSSVPCFIPSGSQTHVPRRTSHKLLEKNKYQMLY